MAVVEQLGLDISPFEQQLNRATQIAGQRARQMEGKLSFPGGSGGGAGGGGGGVFGLPKGMAGPLAGVFGGAAVASKAMDAFNDTLEREAQLAGLSAVSTENVTAQMERLKILAESPGLGLNQVIEGSMKLQAVGLSAKQAEDAMREFGNGLALVGKGKEDLDGVLLALTQIVGKGKVSAEEINQIAERMPQIRSVMADVFGTSDTEAIQKMGISAEKFIGDITKGLESLARAPATAKNELENMQDQMHEMNVLAGTFIATLLKPAMPWLTETLKDMQKGVELLQGKGGLDDIEGRRSKGKAYRDANGDIVIDNPADQRAAAAAQAKDDFQSAFFDLADAPDTIGQQQAADRAQADVDRMVAEQEAIDAANVADADRMRKQRESQQKENEQLRKQTEESAFGMLPRGEQIKAFRDQLSKSLGIDVTSSDGIGAGLTKLQKDADSARSKGDIAGENAALSRLAAAQDAAGRLAQLDGGGGGPRYAVQGAATTAIDRILGRGAGLVGEDRKQTEYLEKAVRALTEIKDNLTLTWGNY